MEGSQGKSLGGAGQEMATAVSDLRRWGSREEIQLPFYVQISKMFLRTFFLIGLLTTFTRISICVKKNMIVLSNEVVHWKS